MANNRIRVAPSVTFNEIDLTFNPVRQFGLTRLMIMGEFEYGPAFQNIRVSNYNEFSAKYGKLNPCKYVGTNQLKFQGAYTAKQFLKESNELYVCRVLGLSGYDAGDLWTINLGANVDVNTIQDGATSEFNGELVYSEGALTSAIFSNGVLQEMFEAGLLSGDIFGGFNVSSGTTFNYISSNGFVSDCDGNFSGARFNGVITEREDQYVCLSATTTQSGFIFQTGNAETCTVLYSAGTQTIGSTFYVDVVNPIIIVNQTTNEVEVVPFGMLVAKGGTITHNIDDSVTIVNGTITFPNGDVFSGGTYKICDIDSNNAYYDCLGINGTNYTIVTGTTTVNTPVFQSSSSTSEIQFPTGLVKIYLSGTCTVQTASANQTYDNRVVIGLRSKAQYNSNEEVVFRVKNTNFLIEPLVSGAVIKPYDDFRLRGFDTDGVEFSFIVSLDRRKSNYINKVFAERPNCCDNGLDLYISESYQSMFDNLVTQNLVYCIKPTVCHSTSLYNYKTQYRSAETPYVVSELRGSKVQRLFKFVTISDGDMANRHVKVSITNIRPDRRLFDVIVRDFNDTDANPVILEQFANCTLDIQSTSFVARQIGGTTPNNDVYPQRSMYITVEIDANCVYDAFPSGFEGYPVVDYSCAQAPIVQYKTSYGPRDKARNEYLGFSTSFGYDQDLFDFHGHPESSLVQFTGETKGFHMDKDAVMPMIDGVGTKHFEVGLTEFRNEADLSLTALSKINTRKFTVCFYGGFDGWDIHRMNTGNRTNSDFYTVNGTNGILGLSSGAFDSYVMEDFDGEFSSVLNSDYYAYLKGIRTIANPQEIKYNLVVTPNVNTIDNSNLIEEMVEMLEVYRCDAFYIVDTPTRDADGLPYNASFLGDRLDGEYDSSYLATYAYETLYNDTENNQYIYTYPSVDLPRIFAVSDRVSKIWFAPAGVTRGRSEFLDVIKNPNASEQDNLYSGRINSMWRYNGSVLAWGNRSMKIDESRTSVLTDINVRRLIIYIRQLLSDVSVSLLFEQNDAAVRRQFENLVNPILNNIREERGLFRFAVQLDNSPEAFQTNKLTGKILLWPTRALEQIEIGFTLTNDGAEFDDI